MTAPVLTAIATLALAACWTSSAQPAEPQPIAAEPAPAPARRSERRPEPTPEPAPPAPALSNSTLSFLDRAAISSTMATVKGRILACASQAPKAKGTLKLRVAVDPSGSAVATISQGVDPALDGCVVAAMQTAKFPAAQQSTTFVYPFVF